MHKAKKKMRILDDEVFYSLGAGVYGAVVIWFFWTVDYSSKFISYHYPEVRWLGVMMGLSYFVWASCFFFRERYVSYTLVRGLTALVLLFFEILVRFYPSWLILFKWGDLSFTITITKIAALTVAGSLAYIGVKFDIPIYLHNKKNNTRETLVPLNRREDL